MFRCLLNFKVNIHNTYIYLNIQDNLMVLLVDLTAIFVNKCLLSEISKFLVILHRHVLHTYIYNELSPKNRFSLCNKSRHCAYITYRVKTWFLKNTCYLCIPHKSSRILINLKEMKELDVYVRGS